MVFETPHMIKESVAASHIALWGQPQFTRFGMFWFTVFFGWFGAHHLMLRSPLTALLFFLTNTFLGGYWYFFDLLQLTYSSYDELNTYGLGSPFLVEFGIAVGMWKDDKKPAGSKVENANNPITKYISEKRTYEALSHRVNPSETPAAQRVPPVSSEVKTGGWRQRGGDGELGSPPSSARVQNPPKQRDESLKGTAGQLGESILKLALEKLLTARDKEKPKEYNWEESPPSAWTTFFFLLATPFEVLSSAIAGDMWSACFHGSFIFPFMFMIPFAIARAIGVSVYTILFPMDVFIQGVSRPIPYIWDNTVDVNGRSPSIQRSKIGSIDPEANFKAFAPFIDIFKQGLGLAEGMLAYMPLAAGGRVGKAAGDFGEAAKDTAKAAIATAEAAKIAALQGVKPERSGPVQRGGGKSETSETSGQRDTLSLGIIGAVLAGGLLLGVSRNGVFQGKDDSPPNARRV